MTAAAIADSFAHQAEACGVLGSPLYEELLGVAASDIRSGGPIERIVGDFEGDPVDAALALRLMGGVHRLVLMGLADDLARHFPSVGGRPDPATLHRDFLDAAARHHGYLRDALAVAPQTNDVGRSTALLAGLGAALDGRRLRVRLLEIGSAAGLNLLADRYRHEAGQWTWGPPDSPVEVRTEWRGPPPELPTRLDVAHRHGCDVAPIDITVDSARLRMVSFIWPDQDERMARARAAIAVASTNPPQLDCEDAVTWLRRRLAEPSDRRTLTVVQHSVMWQYLAARDQLAIDEILRAAGEAATRSRPFAHVSVEPPREVSDGGGFAVRVATWPGGEDRLLGRAHPHGAWIAWEA